MFSVILLLFLLFLSSINKHSFVYFHTRELILYLFFYFNMVSEPRTQGPRELEWVSLAKEIPICATDAVEPEF